MTEPIRVLHFADAHIGMENYGKLDAATGLSTRVRDFLQRMDTMIDYARDNDVDLTIFAGDAFKTRNPNPTFQREFAWRVRDLTALAPVVMLVGNHDLAPTLMKASSIEIYDTLNVPNVWVASDYETRVVETKRGSCVVGAAPYPIRARILEDERTAGKTIAETDQLLQVALGRKIEMLAEEADEHDMPRLLTGHFTVNGAAFSSERGIMLGRDIEVPISSVADERWDYVALGHVHKHQNLTKGRQGSPPVVYSGSLERIDFGEEADTKGYCWVELERYETKWRFIPSHARPFVTLRADLRTSDQPTLEAVQLVESHDLREAVVRMILELSLESEAKLDEGMIRDALRRGGVSMVASIRKEVEHPTRARLGDSPEGLTDDQLLYRYLISKQIGEARRETLMREADIVFTSAAQKDQDGSA